MKRVVDILFLILLLTLSSCTVEYQSITTKEQIDFHRNYHGANGDFSPRESYEWLYK